MFDLQNRLRFLATGITAITALVGAYWLGNNHASTQVKSVVATQTNAYPATPGTDPYVTGPVKNTLRKHSTAMQELWFTYLKKPHAKNTGVVELDWRINGEGNAERVGVVSSTLNDQELEEGLVRIIAGLNFPAPDVPQKYVVHKFNFKKEEVTK
jgi:hypothetical protein